MALQSTLPARGRQALHRDMAARYRSRVLAAFAGRVERIVLFGSRVRGGLHEDSDWDFAVYLDHEPRSDDEERLRELGRVLGEETGEQVQSFLLAPEAWRATDELACNIREDGVIIHGEDQTPMIERPVLAHARDALDKAERFAVQAERAVLEAYETVVHNSYYAMFHAARAALLRSRARPAPSAGGWSKRSQGW